MEEKQKNIFIYLLVLFFSIFVGTSLFLSFNKKKISNNPTNNQSQKKDDFDYQNEERTVGYFKLETDNKSYSLNDQIKVFLIADSQNKNISGFDLILNFNKENFAFVKVNPLSSDFDIYPSLEDDRLILTGVKSLKTEENPIVFNNMKLLEIVFKPKKSGSFDLILEDQYMRNKTKMVDEKTNILEPKLFNLNLKID